MLTAVVSVSVMGLVLLPRLTSIVSAHSFPPALNDNARSTSPIRFASARFKVKAQQEENKTTHTAPRTLRPPSAGNTCTYPPAASFITHQDLIASIIRAILIRTLPLGSSPTGSPPPRCTLPRWTRPPAAQGHLCAGLIATDSSRTAVEGLPSPEVASSSVSEL